MNGPFYTVEKKPLIVDGDALEGHIVTRRTDTGQLLGTGKNPAVVQNHLLFGNMSEAVSKLGLQADTSYRIYKNGAQAFMDLRFPTLNFESKRKVGDITECGITLSNSFDGSLAVELGTYHKRLWCSNGCTTMVKTSAVKRKHTSGIDVDVLIERVLHKVKEFKNYSIPFWTGLQDYSLTDDEEQEIVYNLVPPHLDRKEDPALAKGALFPAYYRNDVLKALKNPRGETRNRDRSLWEVYNAFTEVSTHIIRPKAKTVITANKYDTDIGARFAQLLEA